MVKKLLLVLFVLLFAMGCAVGGAFYDQHKQNKPEVQDIRKTTSATELDVQNEPPVTDVALDEDEAEKPVPAPSGTGRLNHIPSYVQGQNVDLKIDFEPIPSGDKLHILVKSNLPDGVELLASVSNASFIREEMGLTKMRPGQISDAQFKELEERTYSAESIDYVQNGEAWFIFDYPREDTMVSLTVTMPVLRLQSAQIRSLLGEKGENLSGDYVVNVQEADGKTVNFNASFRVENKEVFEP